MPAQISALTPEHLDVDVGDQKVVDGSIDIEGRAASLSHSHLQLMFPLPDLSLQSDV
jgi:hypothetical protein